MKKLITLAFVCIMGLFVLTGCSGKTKEEKALEEIKQQIVQEASDSLSRSKTKSEEREERQKLKKELDELYNPQLQAEYDAMIAAVTPEDTMAHGDRYNELIQERNDRGRELEVSWSGRSSYQPIDRSYLSKALFLSAKKYGEFDEYKIYHTGESFFQGDRPDTLLLMCTNNDENNGWSELVFVHEDFSACRLVCRDSIGAGNGLEITNISDSHLEICAIYQDWAYYLFDITDAEAALLDKSTGYSDSDEYSSKVKALFPGEERMGRTYTYEPAWGDTLEDLNKMIIKNSEFGAASSSHQ